MNFFKNIKYQIETFKTLIMDTLANSINIFNVFKINLFENIKYPFETFKT